MNYKKSNFDEKDNRFSVFARALALPIRIQIVRLIIENGFSISKEELYSDNFSRDTINKHLSELRTLGILTTGGNKGHIVYNINEHWFKQMTDEFFGFFGRCVSIPKPEITDRYLQESAPEANLVQPNSPGTAHPHFGVFIKKRREELFITQENFARKLRIDRGLLSRIECGKKEIKLHKLRVLSQALYLEYDAVKKEYYSYQLAEIIDESGYDESVIASAREKLGHFSQLK